MMTAMDEYTRDVRAMIKQKYSGTRSVCSVPIVQPTRYASSRGEELFRGFAKLKAAEEAKNNRASEKDP